jgi:hypothetical protein
MSAHNNKLKMQSTTDDRPVKFRRTHEKVNAWNYAFDRIEYLLGKLRSELSNSRVGDDYDPEVVHGLRKIQSQMNRIKQDVQWIEKSLEETLVVEREWWKK